MSNSVQTNLARSILAYEASLNAAKQAGLPLEIIQGKKTVHTSIFKVLLFGLHDNKWRCSHLTNFGQFIGLNG